MSAVCDWCGTAIVERLGAWCRAKGGVAERACDVSDDGLHAPQEVRGQHDEGQVCHCVWSHRPPYLELNRHHIVPLSLGGPDAPDNIAWLCPTTHTNVHEVMRHMLRDHVLYTYRQVQDRSTRPVSRYAYDLAAEGYRRWLATQPAPTS